MWAYIDMFLVSNSMNAQEFEFVSLNDVQMCMSTLKFQWHVPVSYATEPEQGKIRSVPLGEESNGDVNSDGG